MCVTVWVLRYKNKKNGDRGTIVFTATLRLRVPDYYSNSNMVVEKGKIKLNWCQYIGKVHCLKKNQNAPRPSEHLPAIVVVGMNLREATQGKINSIRVRERTVH